MLSSGQRNAIQLFTRIRDRAHEFMDSWGEGRADVVGRIVRCFPDVMPGTPAMAVVAEDPWPIRRVPVAYAILNQQRP